MRGRGPSASSPTLRAAIGDRILTKRVRPPASPGRYIKKIVSELEIRPSARHSFIDHNICMVLTEKGLHPIAMDPKAVQMTT